MRNNVKIFIGGKAYKVSTQTQAEHLQKIASKLNSQIESLKSSNSSLSSLTAAILVAVDSMNELYKTEKSITNMRTEINRYIKSSKASLVKSKKLEQENAALKKELEEVKSILNNKKMGSSNSIIESDVENDKDKKIL